MDHNASHEHHNSKTHGDSNKKGEKAAHGHGADHSGHETMFRNRFWVSLILTIPVLLFSPMIQMWFGFSMPEFFGSGLIGPGFAIIIFLYGGLPFLQMAVPEIKNRQPGMMTLISLAITTAFIYSLFATFTNPESAFFWEMATLIVIMLLGHWLEMRSVRQASGALDELAKLMPDTAERINTDGQTEEIPVSDLQHGDLVLVRPGESVPVDGEIVEGSSTLNESLITGESKPTRKGVGDAVVGGTINGDGSLRIQVVAIGEETTLAGILRLVAEAQKSKSKTQILADRAAGWLFYIAVGTAALTAVLWTIAVGFNVVVIERVVTVLVMACPHALGLAVPLVVAISTSMGAKNGVLVRDRLALESARLVDTIIFDKTGTLTQGNFGVTDFVVVSSWADEQALALILAVEGDSEHPIAQGIRQKGEELGISPVTVKAFEAIKGQGIKAEFEGRTVYVGGPRLLEKLEVDLPETVEQFRQKANTHAYTVIYLIVDGEVVAAFALADMVRDESKQVVEHLQKLGYEIAMLTGDSQYVAQAVANELGIDQVFAEVLPEHKEQLVAKLQKQGKKVAMVGDGINDAPALSRADVGIAIGSGTDVAIESAGIVLVRSNPNDVAKIFELSRATYRKMIQNLIWATGYNIVALPLAAGVLAPIGIIFSPAAGAVLMSISTIIVAINAQLLRRTNLEDNSL